MCARGLQESVIVQSFSLSEIALVAAAGISPMYLMGTADQASPAAVVAAGATFVGVNKDASNFPGVVAGLKAAGLRVLAWTVDMQNDYDDVMAAGCDGIFTNEPLYAARDYAYRSTTAPWPVDGTYSHGMLVYPGVGPLVAYPTRAGRPGPVHRRSRRMAVGAGRDAVPGRPGVPGRGRRRHVLDHRDGWSYDIPPVSDRTRWGGIYFGVDTDDCPDDVDTSTGYLVALRWNGALEVFGQPADRTGMIRLGGTTTSSIGTPRAGGSADRRSRRHLPPGGRPAGPAAGRARVRPSDGAGRHAGRRLR